MEQQRAAGLGSASVGSSEAAELEEEVMNHVQQVKTRNIICCDALRNTRYLIAKTAVGGTVH